MKDFEEVYAQSQIEGREKLDWSATPTIPTSVYESLPPILMEGCSVFQTEREKDVFLTGAITVLSGCMPTVTGLYNGSTIYSNLFGFVVAPAASGKGVMSWAKTLGMAYHKHLREIYKLQYEDYQAELSVYEQNKKSGEKPIPPPFKLQFSPADTSKASLIQTLSDCGETVTMFETEADTLSGTMGKEWGGFSDLFRKAFHHEPYSYQRKTGNEYIELEMPRLSVMLSGTPMQVQRLISSAEDGLFSRFIFYAFSVEPQWQDVSPLSGKVSLNSHFEILSAKVKRMMIHYENESEINFSLKDHQWKELNEVFGKWLREVSSLISDDAVSVVKRLGLISFRISMIFSILRKYECGKGTPVELRCEDIDFQNSLLISEVYLNHSLQIFDTLSHGKSRIDGMKKHFYDFLPDKFGRKETSGLGVELGISDRTITNYLSDFIVKGLLIQPKYGYYQKTK
jgi:hypothetical protein